MSDEFAYKRDEKLQKRLSAEVDALAKLPGNATCADCGDPKRIRFCSVTLGVFLCNRCYGVHRALGAHVTRVKCLGLDAWKPEEVDLLRAVGNARAAQRYEATAPPDLVRPTAASASAHGRLSVAMSIAGSHSAVVALEGALDPAAMVGGCEP